jgi:hypothetical protein
LVVNVAAVLYIAQTKRLCGLRGGHAAYEAERHETSLLEVEEAAGTGPGPLQTVGDTAPASASARRGRHR